MKTIDSIFQAVRADVIQEFNFFVPGKVVAQGSKNAFARICKDGTARATMVETAKTLPQWREVVRKFGVMAMPVGWDLDGFFMVSSIYYFERPKSHFTPRGLLKPNAPLYCGKKPDADKLDRARGDALSKHVYADDAKIVCPLSLKVFAYRDMIPGAMISVARLRGAPTL